MQAAGQNCWWLYYRRPLQHLHGIQALHLRISSFLNGSRIALQSTGQHELAHEGSRGFWASNHVCVHVDAITSSIHLFAGMFRDKNSGGVLAFGCPFPHLVSSFNQMSAIINIQLYKESLEEGTISHFTVTGLKIHCFQNLCLWWWIAVSLW